MFISQILIFALSICCKLFPTILWILFLPPLVISMTIFVLVFPLFLHHITETCQHSTLVGIPGPNDQELSWSVIARHLRDAVGMHGFHDGHLLLGRLVKTSFAWLNKLSSATLGNWWWCSKRDSRMWAPHKSIWLITITFFSLCFYRSPFTIGSYFWMCRRLAVSPREIWSRN